MQFFIPEFFTFLSGNLYRVANGFRTNSLTLYNSKYLYPFLIFGFFGVYAFINYKDKDFFLKSSALMIPFFIAAHMITGVISESRQMLPLGAIIIQMGLHFIFINKTYHDF